MAVGNHRQAVGRHEFHKTAFATMLLFLLKDFHGIHRCDGIAVDTHLLRMVQQIGGSGTLNPFMERQVAAPVLPRLRLPVLLTQTVVVAPRLQELRQAEVGISLMNFHGKSQHARVDE